jgi:hypothetical protein
METRIPNSNIRSTGVTRITRTTRIEKKNIAQQITLETRSNQKEKISSYRFQYNLGIGTLFVQHTNFPDMCPAKVSNQ